VEIDMDQLRQALAEEASPPATSAAAPVKKSSKAKLPLRPKGNPGIKTKRIPGLRGLPKSRRAAPSIRDGVKMNLSALKRLLKRIAGIEDRVEKLEARPAAIGHLLSAGGEIKPQRGELFEETLRRHREYEHSRASGGLGMNPAKRFQEDNRYDDEVKWRD
jgi:hypothetical protein